MVLNRTRFGNRLNAKVDLKAAMLAYFLGVPEGVPGVGRVCQESGVTVALLGTHSGHSKFRDFLPRNWGGKLKTVAIWVR